MSDFANKRYWLVGASEGLGRALAYALDAEGASLVISARSEDRLNALAADLKDATALPLDVSDADAVKKAGAKLDNLDGVIYAAGVYTPMKAGEWNADDVELMIDVNFAGAARVMAQTVPRFVRKDSGHVVLIGSLSGFRGLPGAIGYGASKSGMMHLAENMNADLHNTGVKVQLINPGFIKTRLTDKNDFAMPFIMTPEKAADHVIAAMKSNRFQSNFPRPFSWLFRGSNFLPAPLYYWLFGAAKTSEPETKTSQIKPAE